VTIFQGGREHRVLFDTGIFPGRADREHAPPRTRRQVVVLSHGHFDHTTGIDGLIRTRGKANVPVLAQPEFWSAADSLFPAAIR
jgi:7,8-dihydropterin-6-yl-methyl-4-(beta-D-ribofuranosyl)aminobenzene 5'-phosphate synthase